jgi:hypothetical protein
MTGAKEGVVGRRGRGKGVIDAWRASGCAMRVGGI